MQKGDIVVVIGSDSIPEYFLGRYGRVDFLHRHKVVVEFNARVGTTGGLSHTAYESDLRVVGAVNYETPGYTRDFP